PMPARSVISVILEVETVILLAAAAEDLDMPRRICGLRQRLGFLPQGIGPEMTIELAVAEMICLLDKYSKQCELIDHLPQFYRQFLIVQRIRRGERHARPLQLLEVSGPPSFLVIHHVFPE